MCYSNSLPLRVPHIHTTTVHEITHNKELINMRVSSRAFICTGKIASQRYTKPAAIEVYDVPSQHITKQTS